MSAVAASAAALALYYMFQKRMLTACYANPSAAPIPVEASRSEALKNVEHAPNNWFEALYFFKEVLKLMYTETLGRWGTIDLFVGLAYLSNKETSAWPATDIARKGRQVNLACSKVKNLQLQDELMEIRRYMLYCRGLKFKTAQQQARFWIEHTGIDESQILFQHATAGLLRPAWVLIRDDELHTVVLCVRGTQSLKDLFTSLTGATKPHHVVTSEGVTLGYSHLGMLAAARWLARHAFPQLKEALLAAGPEYKLRVVGHSMGAGTAVMLTMMLRAYGPQPPQLADARCVAIACPACMTVELANSCKDFVTSVVNGTDIVPTFCAASVDALREDVTASSWFAEFKRDLHASFMRALQGSVQGLGSATQWTARNILSPATYPFAACYTRTAATCGPGAVRRRRSISDGSDDGDAAAIAAAEREPFFLPPQSASRRSEWVRQLQDDGGFGPRVSQASHSQSRHTLNSYDNSNTNKATNVTSATMMDTNIPPLPASTNPQISHHDTSMMPSVSGSQSQLGSEETPIKMRGLSNETLEETLRSCLYAAQQAPTTATQAAHIAATIQLLDGKLPPPEVTPRGAVDAAAAETPALTASGSAPSLMLAGSPTAAGGDRVAALRRRALWPWSTGAANQASPGANDLSAPLMGAEDPDQQADDSSTVADTASVASDSRGLNKDGGRGAGWGGWLSWIGLGSASTTPASNTSATPTTGTHGAGPSRLQHASDRYAMETPTRSSSLTQLPQPAAGVLPSQQADAAESGVSWVGTMFAAMVAPARARARADAREGIVPALASITGRGAAAGAADILGGVSAGGAVEEDDSLLEGELLLDAAASAPDPLGPRAPGASVGSDALRQQVQAGISAVVAAVTHEAEEGEEGGNNARLAQEAEQVLLEATDGSDSTLASPRQTRPPGGSASDAATHAAGRSDGGLLASTSSPAAAAPGNARRAVSKSTSGGPDHAATSEGLRARHAAARAAAAAATEQAGMMEINVDGHLLQASAVPGFAPPSDSAQSAGAGSAGAAAVPGAGRHVHRRLYPAGRILHFMPLHALPEDALDKTIQPNHDLTPPSTHTPPAPIDGMTDRETVAATDAGRTTMQGEGVGAAGAAATRPMAPTWVLLEIDDPTAYGRVKLCKTMIMDHFVSSYLIALDSVVSQLSDHVAALDAADAARA